MADLSGYWDDQLVTMATDILNKQEASFNCADMELYESQLHAIDREIERREGAGVWTIDPR